jgi:hypothetical protein
MIATTGGARDNKAQRDCAFEIGELWMLGKMGDKAAASGRADQLEFALRQPHGQQAPGTLHYGSQNRKMKSDVSM